eukprot:5891926-Pleurochrysis_carterae.AAC.1
MVLSSFRSPPSTEAPPPFVPQRQPLTRPPSPAPAPSAPESAAQPCPRTHNLLSRAQRASAASQRGRLPPPRPVRRGRQKPLPTALTRAPRGLPHCTWFERHSKTNRRRCRFMAIVKVRANYRSKSTVGKASRGPLDCLTRFLSPSLCR